MNEESSKNQIFSKGVTKQKKIPPQNNARPEQKNFRQNKITEHEDQTLEITQTDEEELFKKLLWYLWEITEQGSLCITVACEPKGEGKEGRGTDKLKKLFFKIL